MEVKSSFTVDVPLEIAWRHLLDVPAVAPCVPGAELTEIVGESEYKGTVTVKVGAVKMSYRGTVVVAEVDESAHRVVLNVSASETRGSGTTSGTVTSTATASGPSSTTVDVLSEINVTGRVAQFGRGIIQDVTNRLIKDFASCLETQLKSANAGQPADSGAGDSADATASGPGPTGSNSTDEPGSRDRPSAGAAANAGSAELKALPVALDVTRSAVARGLRRLSKIVDPDKTGE